MEYRRRVMTVPGMGSALLVADVPRFQALVVKTRKHREHQRALLEEMRRKGAVPKRG